MDSPRAPTDDPKAAQPGSRADSERKAAGTVFAVMVGALLLAALMNAETMLTRSESSELGWSRNVSVAFWRPVHRISSTVGLTAPRDGFEAFRDLDRAGPAPSIVSDSVVGPKAEATTDAALPPLTDPGSASRRPGRLGHEAAPASASTPTGAPPRVQATDGAPTTSGADDSASNPTDVTPEDLTADGALTADAADSALPAGAAGPEAPTTPRSLGDPAGLARGGNPSALLGLPGLPPLESVRLDAEPNFALRRPTSDDPLRILIVGDSTLDAVGTSMLRELGATGVTSGVLDFRVSSGLSRPDFFDWPAHLDQLTPQLQPEIVVVMLGANDAQAFAVDGQAVEYGTEQWFATYRARVAALLDQLTAEDRWVVWIGQPVMRKADFDAKMRQLNQLFVEEVARHSTARFVDSRAVTADEAGGYSAYLPDGGGAPRQIRQNDGIHLTSAGGDRLSPVVIGAINEIAPLY